MHIFLRLVIQDFSSLLPIFLGDPCEFLLSQIHGSFDYLGVGFNADHVLGVWDVHDLNLGRDFIQFLRLEFIVFAGVLYNILVALLLLLLLLLLILELLSLHFLGLEHLELLQFGVEPLIRFSDLIDD